MKHLGTITLAILLLAGNGSSSANADALEAGFRNPPAQARPYIWWQWMNGNVTREGITADLEAMARVGIGGAQIFNLGPDTGCQIPAGPVDYLSDEWLDLVKHAASECQRLGFEFCIHNCAGWATSGGPWVKPQNASQILVFSEVKVSGGQRIEQKLPLPEMTDNVHKLPKFKLKEEFYRDIAVFAFPTPKNDQARLSRWVTAALYRTSRVGRQPSLHPTSSDTAIDPKSIVEITEHLQKDGTLSWDAPAGTWTILRLGHTARGQTNNPAPESGRGLEIDKLSRPGVDVHWKHGIQPILEHLGPLTGNVLTTIHIDSYEGGFANWTPEFKREFISRRGYDPTPYLIALTGRIVGDGPISERFLWDFRRTVADLYADHYYGYFAKQCRDRGLIYSIEPYRGPFESMRIASHADIPMGEFWTDKIYVGSLKLASSAAHLHNRPLVTAEAFTAGPPNGRWLNHPGSLRRMGDLAWTRGVNRFVFHRFTHQPWLDKVPGMTMGVYGAHIDRTNTWWEPGRAWMKYIARSQFLLQQGTSTSEVLCFVGEASPIVGATPSDIKAAGYDYDLCGTDVMAALKVEDGQLVVPSGKCYHLLVLPNTPFQTPALVKKIRELVRDGAVVVGPKPQYSPTLAGFPESEKQVIAIGEEIWGDDDAATSHRLAKGQAFTGISPAEVLSQIGVAPAVQLPEGLAWIHRRAEEADIFFVSNQTDKAVHTVAGFLAAGRVPELWDAETDTIRPADGWKTVGKHVQVSLNFDAEKSVFVVFRKPGKPESKPVLREWDEESLSLTGPWNLRFQEERGAPATAKFDKLMPWNEHADPGIKYFSGTATNTINFDLSKNFLKNGEEVWLDLGEVAVIAEVRLNGKNLGVLWHKPFRIEVSKTLKPGANTLEVDVTNLWINRLIGDEQHPDDCAWTESYLRCWPDWLTKGKPRPSTKRVAFTTWKHWHADDPLQPSGLIGPVNLRTSRLVPVASDQTQASTISTTTVKQWSAPYRGWHYYPDHVISAKPNIKGFEKVHMVDVPTVYQLPGDERWYMTFIGFDGKGYQSFVAESDDLVRWTNMRLAMGYGPAGEFDHGGVVLGAFLYDSYDIKAPRILKKKDGRFFSLYGAYPRQGGYELRPGYEGIASSEDGLAWQRAKDQPILSVHQEDCAAWEKDCIYQPWLVENEGKYFNFYNAANGHIEQMGLARSDDLLNWRRYAQNPVIPNGPKESYNQKFSSDGKVFWDRDHWVCFFFGVGRGGAHIMAAFSRDLFHWTVDPEPLYKAGGNLSGLDKKYAHKISLVWNPANETYYLFYNAVGNKGRGIGLITSKPIALQE
jgi:predicted GH43/DUF377 family glycosyl hydrolase